MKQVTITGVRKAELTEVPIPKPVGNQALVKIHAAPMCTEYKHYLDGEPRDRLGHEAAGEVIEVAEPGPVQPGDRVVAMPLNACGECALCKAGDFIHCKNNTMSDATMAQYVLKPAFMLKKIPDDVTYEKAALGCCGLGASFGAMQNLALTAYDTLLITGLGPVGLGAVVNAAFRNTRVIAVESNEYRCNLAKELGVEFIVDPRDPDVLDKIREFCGGTGPDAALDCSGAVAAHRLCIDAVRPKGKVAFVGECNKETQVVVSRDLIRKGIQLIGSWHYNLNDFPKLMNVIRRSPLTEKLITHQYPMSQIDKAFEQSVSQQNGKIILKPWE